MEVAEEEASSTEKRGSRKSSRESKHQDIEVFFIYGFPFRVFGNPLKHLSLHVIIYIIICRFSGLGY